MIREGLKKLAGDKRFIAGIYNYCDRWCERCPQTHRCLNFSLSEEEFSDPETHDIRNEAFWKKISGILQETLELLKETGKKWGIEPETLDAVRAGDTERLRANGEAAEEHVVCRAAKAYARTAEDWFHERESLLLGTAGVANEAVGVEESFAMIRWYQLLYRG
jgi:hypothetical protein